MPVRMCILALSIYAGARICLNDIQVPDRVLVGFMGFTSWCRQAPGTLICRTRDMSDVLMTSIVLKSDVTLMDVVSTRMLGQYGFLATVFGIFRDQQISVDVVATSEISVSLTLDHRFGSPSVSPSALLQACIKTLRVGFWSKGLSDHLCFAVVYGQGV